MKPKEISTQYGNVGKFLSIYSAATQEAARRLMSDERMAAYWNHGFATPDFEDATHVFELAESRRAWDTLSRKAQAEWLREFDKIVDRLAVLVKTAPTTPAAWGFPVRDAVLAEAARRMGAHVPESDEPLGVQAAGMQFENAVDGMGWTIMDSLRHFQHQQHVDTASQPLAKPRDAKAPRAFFLHELQAVRPRLSAVVVATVASIMFECDVDERKARQYRPDGLSRKRKNPA